MNARDEYTGQGWFYRTESELTDVPDDIPDEAVGVYLNNNNITQSKGWRLLQALYLRVHQSGKQFYIRDRSRSLSRDGQYE